MDGYLSNKPKIFVDDLEKLYRQRRREAQKLEQVDPKEEVASSSSEKTPSSTPKAPPSTPLMGDQEPERTIGELCIPNVQDLPMQALDEIGVPYEIKGSDIHMVQNSLFTGKEDTNLHLQALLTLLRHAKYKPQAYGSCVALPLEYSPKVYQSMEPKIRINLTSIKSLSFDYEREFAKPDLIY